MYVYFLCGLVCTCIHESDAELICMFFSDVLTYCVMLQALYAIVLTSDVYNARVRVVVVVHWHCSAQLSMFNMEKRYRNKIIIIIIIMTYNNCHAAKEASPLQKGNTVYIKDMKKSGTVINNHHNPRSFIIQTDSGVIRPNRTHLVPTNENNSPADTTKMASNSGCRSCSPPSSHSKSTTAPLQQPDLQSSPPASSPPLDVPPPPVQRNETPKRTNLTTVVTGLEEK